MLNSGVAFAFDVDKKEKQAKQEDTALEIDEEFLNFLAESTFVGNDAIDVLDMLEAESIEESGFDSLEALSEKEDIINRKGETNSHVLNNREEEK